MPRLIVDPSSQLPPDYTTDTYNIARAHLIAANANWTDQHAADILTSAWRANNVLEKLQWRQQVEADAQGEEERMHRVEEERVLKATIEAREREEAAAEERKKFKTKHRPLAKRGVPDRPINVPSSAAMCRLEKGEWTPLWYYSPKGLKYSSGTVNIEEDHMTLIMQADGSSVWTSAASTKEAKGLVEDKDLEWEEFCVATSHMLEAFARASWPVERIRMFAEFWTNIQEHPLRYSGEVLDKKSLLLYQAEQRRQWHHSLAAPEGGYDLSEINEKVLNKTEDRIYRQDRARREMDDINVRTLHPVFFSTLVLTIGLPTCSMHYSSNSINNCNIYAVRFV